MSRENHSNYLQNKDLDTFSKTGYSNSRLSGQTLGKSQPELSFDAMTIVGNLNKNNAQKLSEFMSVEPQIRLWDILQTKFKAKALQEKVYIEYDKVKADTWDRRNMRVEFNPNKLTHEEMLWLKQNIIDYMEDDGFTRLEKYFGVRDSDRFIRIYNKKQERKDNADVEVMSEHLWRVEVELKRDMVDYWNDCFNDLHILKPAWTTLEKINEQAMVYTLLHEESMWGKLSKNTKTKFKKLIREISPIDLTELMKSTLKANEKQLKKHIDFWQHEFGFWK
ncbi:MAG: replication initiation factor domain-containing protein [Streptococcus mitis]|nr:replication initiation factor domain-containing protein [Streptococcus mitis]